MGSTGLARNGQGLVPALQRAWVVAVQQSLQQHDDKLDVAKAVAESTAEGIAAAVERLRVLVVILCASAVLGAASALGVFAIKLLEVLR